MHGLDVSMGVLGFFWAPLRSLRDKDLCHSYGCLEWHFYTMRFADPVVNEVVAWTKFVIFLSLAWGGRNITLLYGWWYWLKYEEDHIYIAQHYIQLTVIFLVISKVLLLLLSLTVFFFYFCFLLRFAQLVYENCLKQILSKGQQLQGSSRGALIPRFTVKSKWNINMRLLHINSPKYFHFFCSVSLSGQNQSSLAICLWFPASQQDD